MESRFGVARLNSDGTVDSSFNPNIGSASSVRVILPLPDGKIVVAGWVSSPDNTSNTFISRLNADGALDSTFNSNANGWINTMALQPDGKVLIGGEFTNFGLAVRHRVARLNSDGSLDLTFNAGTGLGPDAGVHSLVLLQDGKVIIGGEFSTYKNVPARTIARLTADGALDTLFTSVLDGTVETMVFQSDGKLIAGGMLDVAGTSQHGLARLNTDGVLDTSFVPAFDYQRGFYPWIYAIGIQPDGKIVICGILTAVGSPSEGGITKV